MSSALLGVDEETDTGVYGAYLRAQSDGDLLDIARHLDPLRYPARCDAAGREVRRRGLLHTEAYTAAEGVIRRLALTALALTALTLALAGLLTSNDAAGPSWPTGEMLPDGLPVSEAMRLFGVAILRGAVVWCAHLGIYPLLLLMLGGWIATRAWPVRQHRARADVWRLTTLAFAALTLAVTLAAGPRSAVPVVFAAPEDAPVWQAALPLVDPFYEAQTPPRRTEPIERVSPLAAGDSTGL